MRRIWDQIFRKQGCLAHSPRPPRDYNVAMSVTQIAGQSPQVRESVLLILLLISMAAGF